VTADPSDLTALLTRWGVSPEAQVASAGSGTNNRTLLVDHGADQWVLRISENLTADQVRAEHRLLARLRTAGLPFAVPEPVPALGGEFLVETTAGPATLVNRLPGVCPDLTGGPALERFGRAVGQLSAALGPVPRHDAPHEWLTSRHVHPDVADVPRLGRELAAAGISSELTRPLVGFEHGMWLTGVGAGLPVQVVHGDAAASNVLADEHTGAVTAILDFEIAGAELRVQDLVVALKQSAALDAPDWRRRAVALARGYRSAQELTDAEAAAVPDLLRARAAGTVVWRAGRWRRGQASLDDVAVRLRDLATTVAWLAACGDELRGLLQQAR
jgi:homoserine kinase type II